GAARKGYRGGATRVRAQEDNRALSERGALRERSRWLSVCSNDVGDESLSTRPASKNRTRDARAFQKDCEILAGSNWAGTWAKLPDTVFGDGRCVERGPSRCEPGTSRRNPPVSTGVLH